MSSKIKVSITPKIPFAQLTVEERAIAMRFYDEIEATLEWSDSELMKTLPKVIEHSNRASTAFLEQLKSSKL